MNRVDAFLELAVKQGGSDVHLVAGQPLRLRLNGYLETVRFRELSNRDMDDFLEEFMTDAQREALTRDHHVDFAYESEIAGRFRVSVFQHR
jgi:twitching motility protein PilT